LKNKEQPISGCRPSLVYINFPLYLFEFCKKLSALHGKKMVQLFEILRSKCNVWAKEITENLLFVLAKFKASNSMLP